MHPLKNLNHNLQRWLNWILAILSSGVFLRLRKFLAEFTDAALDRSNIQSLGLWISAFIASIVAVAYAQLFHFAESIFQRLRSSSPHLTFIITPGLFLLAWYLVRRFSPEAGGSGIPQIMAANETPYEGTNRALVDRLLSLRAAFIKILSSLLCVLGGGAIGREGPTLQISTSIFHFIGLQTRRYAPGVMEHTWVVAGAAAGLASAFNTPLGGIVYAIEELGIVHFHRIRTALLGGVIVSGLVAQWLMGSYLYFGFPRLEPISFSFLPFALLNGLVSGLLGALFAKTLLHLVKKRHSYKATSSLALITLLSGIVMAALIFFDRRASGGGTEIVTDFLFRNEEASLTLILTRSFGTLASYLSGAAGGIFAPSLSIGAAIGAYLADLLAIGHTNLMVLLGMIGFLTGVTRTPFTSFILVLEMTDRHSAIFPMMLVALAANWAATRIDPRSFYDHMKEVYMRPSPEESSKS